MRIARVDSVDNAIQFATLIPIAVGFIGGVLIHRFEEAGGGEQLRRGGVLAWIGMAAGFVIGIPVAALYNRLGGSHSPNPVVPNAVEVPIFTAALGAGLGATLALRRLRHGQGPRAP